MQKFTKEQQTEAMDAAIEFASSGPGTGINDRNDVYVYAALGIQTFFNLIPIARIPESELWVPSTQTRYVKTWDGLFALGRPLVDIVAEFLPFTYGYVVPEENGEELEWFAGEDE